MDTIFLFCAIIGGTILLLQFAMTVLGIGGDHGHGDTGIDVGGHDFSGDLHHDLGGNDAGHEVGGHDSPSGDHMHDSAEHSTVWFFKIISFQTLVAAIAFFGLAGKAAQAAKLSNSSALVIALGAGLAAMYGVYHVIRGLHRFNADGTIQIGRSVGQPGTVYIPIPASHTGAGKIQMNLQNRVVEFQAMTAQDRLPCGAKVKVTGVIGPDTVEVESLIEVEKKIHA
ncbi:MAG: hypothetical protein IT427_19855 [Pirellulales bacterium]|nr:hypothetical protein [Pirellulales bacterium]